MGTCAMINYDDIADLKVVLEEMGGTITVWFNYREEDVDVLHLELEDINMRNVTLSKEDIINKLKPALKQHADEIALSLGMQWND